MPPKLTAFTGMDDLTHAIEAYVAGLRSAFTDPLAMEAIMMVDEHLFKSFEGDKEARNQMHYAQCLADNILKIIVTTFSMLRQCFIQINLK